jgi:hypothetical protein
MKINLSVLRNKIDTYVAEYYKLEKKPELIKIDTDMQWLSNMVFGYVSYSIIKLEFKNQKSINISERIINYNDISAKKSCLKKYNIIKQLSEEGNKFLLKGNKAAKISNISLWDYKQKNELKSVINNEFKIAKKAEELGIGPKIYETFICFNEKDNTAYKVVITDFIKGEPLNDWLEKPDLSVTDKNLVYNIVKKKIEKMHENGIIHNGLKYMSSSNIILQIEKGNKIKDVFITDFNNSYDVKDKSTWEYNKFIQDDRTILNRIKNNVISYNNADDVVNYVLSQLLKNKNIIIN